MDWSILIYFLAAVLTAGVGYALWPEHRRRPRGVSQNSFSRDAAEDHAAPSAI